MEDQDAELLRALQDEHGEALFAHAVRLSGGDRQRAEDLVQETLLRAWRYPEALDPERGAVRSWLFTTARNLAIDAWRRRSVRTLSADNPGVQASIAGAQEYREIVPALRRRHCGTYIQELKLGSATEGWLRRQIES